MNWEEYASIIESTSIELFTSEWEQLEKAFKEWESNREKEIQSIVKNIGIYITE